MFWAGSIKQGTTLDLSKQNSKGELLHLSHVTLYANSPEGTHTVLVNYENKKYPLAHLDKKSQNMVSLDLYFNTSSKVVFSVQGPGEVALLGYFEPSEGGVPMEEESNEEGSKEQSEESEEESEESSGEEPAPAKKPPQKSQTPPKKQGKKKSK